MLGDVCKDRTEFTIWTCTGLLGNCRLALERRRLFARGRRAPELLSVDSAKLGQQVYSWGITALDAGPTVREQVSYTVSLVSLCASAFPRLQKRAMKSGRRSQLHSNTKGMMIWYILLVVASVVLLVFSDRQLASNVVSVVRNITRQIKN